MDNVTISSSTAGAAIEAQAADTKTAAGAAIGAQSSDTKAAAGAVAVTAADYANTTAQVTKSNIAAQGVQEETMNEQEQMVNEQAQMQAKYPYLSQQAVQHGGFD